VTLLLLFKSTTNHYEAIGCSQSKAREASGEIVVTGLTNNPAGPDKMKGLNLKKFKPSS